MNATDRQFELQNAQLVLIAATGKLLDVAEDVRRKRDRLFQLLAESEPQTEDQAEEAPK